MNQQLNNLSIPEGIDVPHGDRLIFDWVSFSSRIHKPEDIIDLIGMGDCPWEVLPGFYGYTFRHHFGGVSIHFCEGSMDHVKGFYLLEMSGQGCRTFESYGNGNYDAMFNLVRREQGKDIVNQDCRLTRLDVAYDDLSGVLDLEMICDYADRSYFVSRFRAKNIETLGMPGPGHRIAKGLNCGSKGGNVYLRIYNKALERGFDEKACAELNIPYPFHWIRCELQLRKENACGFANKLSDHNLSELYTGVLKNYLSFREPNPDDSNQRRWEESPWWTAFLDNAKAISIAEKPGVIYNLSACEKYVLTQPVGSIKTLITIFGADAFIEMINSAPAPKNPKYKRLIAQVEHQRYCQERLPGDDEFVEIDSPEAFESFVELCDELRAEYRAIDIHAREKARDIQRSKFNHRIGSELGTTKQKVDRSVWAEEYLRKRGIELK